MQALYKLQQSFAADLWDEEFSRMNAVIMDGRLPAERLFQVYRNNFWITSEEALADIYKVVKRLVGDQFFSYLIDHYLRSYPSRQGNLHQLGCDLALFLSDFKAVEELPYLSDIARLEWACHRVFHARDTKLFNAQALLDIPSEDIPQLHFDMPSSNQLVYSPFPIYQIWCVNQDDYEGNQEINLDSGSESVLITRPGLEVKFLKLDRVEARFLQSLIAGNSLGQATEAALKISENFDLQAVLARYLTCGALIPATTEVSERTQPNNPTGDKQP